jgi:hypothetical protein
MIIKRQPPYPISIVYDVPSANTSYRLTIENDQSTIVKDVLITSSASSKVTYVLTGDLIAYDDDYDLNIYTTTGTEKYVVVQDTLNVVRPYVDVRQLVSTASEIEKYGEDELLARTIINSVVGGDGFMFKKNVLEVVGQGTDYLALWSRGYRVLGVYENSELVYDLSLAQAAIAGYTYGITADQSAIYKDDASLGSYNRAEKKPLQYRESISDSFNAYSALDTPTFSASNVGVMFPEGVDYVIVYETGYKVVPNDIRDATLRLMDDIRCGKLDYYKRAIESYQTDQFTIKWDKRHLEGTGNLIVDKTLEKYTTTLRKPWVI